MLCAVALHEIFFSNAFVCFFCSVAGVKNTSEKSKSVEKAAFVGHEARHRDRKRSPDEKTGRNDVGHVRVVTQQWRRLQLYGRRADVHREWKPGSFTITHLQYRIRMFVIVC